mgnify:CR=1 FL=1
MAAEVLAQAGLRVSVFEAKPSAGRKFLMAGKSGLNLTKDEDPAKFLTQYAEAQAPLRKIIDAFGPADVQTWARDLGQEIFTGSTGRVFPRAMKASPLMRAWMGRLAGLGVTLHTRSRWIGWEGANAKVEAEVVIVIVMVIKAMAAMPAMVAVVAVDVCAWGHSL